MYVICPMEVANVPNGEKGIRSKIHTILQAIPGRDYSSTETQILGGHMLSDVHVPPAHDALLNDPTLLVLDNRYTDQQKENYLVGLGYKRVKVKAVIKDKSLLLDLLLSEIGHYTVNAAGDDIEHIVNETKPPEKNAMFPNASILDTATRANEGPPPSNDWQTANPTNGTTDRVHEILNNEFVNNHATSSCVSAYDTAFASPIDVAIDISTLLGDGKLAEVLAIKSGTEGDSGYDTYAILINFASGTDTLEIWKRTSSTWMMLTGNLTATLAG